MTNQYITKTLFILLMSVVCIKISIAGDIDAGKERAQTCLGCHGIANYANAAPNYKVPKLGGQSAQYIRTALQAYRSGDRQHGSMRANAFSLTDQDIDNIAVYFESLANIDKQPVGEEVRSSALDDEEAALLSSTLSTCITCHGDIGQGMQAQPQNPVLAGQHANYLEHSLLSYQNGQRKNPIMTGLSANLSRKQIELVSKYYEQQTGLITPRLENETQTD